MGNLKIGIVEDELLIAESILEALENLGYEVPEPAGNFDDAIKMIENEKPDLLLLDINLKGVKDGIDLASIIKEEFNIPFIFLTANADSKTVNRAKATYPGAYLLKPFQKEDLFAAIEVAITNHSQKNQFSKSGSKLNIGNAIFIKENNFFHKILFDNIAYLESDHVYVKVLTLDKKKLLVRTSLNNYLEHFDPTVFFRISRSHVINLKHLDGINSSHVVINDEHILIGKIYREELLSKIRLT